MQNRILVIGKVWPEPVSSAAGTRMTQLLDILKQLGEVHFASTAQRTPYSSIEESITTHEILLNDDQFDHWIKALDPILVVFDRFMTEEQFGWRVIENCPKAMRVLNTEDLHFLRKARREAVKQQISIADCKINTPDTSREIASIYRCDLTLCVSPKEIDLLKQIGVAENLLYYLPVFAKEEQEIRPYNERDGYCFIGNFLHEPNWDAVRYLHDYIWPLIRKEQSQASIKIYGAYASEKVKQLHQPDKGFYIEGRAEDALDALSKAKINLAPLRFGAGIKGKILDALSVGTPTIGTSIAYEGMHEDKDVWEGTITDDPSTFAKLASQLYRDELAWNVKQKQGFELLVQFNSDLFEDAFVSYMEYQMNQLDKHRANNIIGQAFQHQSLMSTKYLSKYIMAKNAE